MLPYLMLSLFIIGSLSFTADLCKAQREKMVRTQIERRGISDKATLQAMRSVKRHLFVRKNLIKRAYDDRPLPIGYGQKVCF